MVNSIKSWELFDLTKSLAGPLLRELVYPWTILNRLAEHILQIGPTLPAADYHRLADDIWVAKSAVVAPDATLIGPLIIGENSEVRPGAYIRGQVLVGEQVVVGHATELKRVILFNQVQVPHFNYVGDSILGYRTHLGAGAITSNVKSDKSKVVLRLDSQNVETGLKKLGALVGDNVEVGSNSVLNPGAVVGRNTLVYPLTMVRGFIPPNSILKQSGEAVARI